MTSHDEVFTTIATDLGGDAFPEVFLIRSGTNRMHTFTNTELSESIQTPNSESGVLDPGGDDSRGGVAGDFTRDGAVDFMYGSLGASQLVLGVQDPASPLDFTLTSDPFPPAASHRCMCTSDLNHDGWLDVFVSISGGDPNQLWISNGGIAVRMPRDLPLSRCYGTAPHMLHAVVWRC